MVDQTSPSAEPEASVCPWCSARYTGEPDTCPSCGAALAVDPATDPALPGLTAIDADAILRNARTANRSRPRGGRLLSWISGEYPDDTPTASEVGALAPPDADVRREMLRLALEAEVANLQAEADALLAEATVEGHAPGATAEETAAADAVVHDLEAVSAELEEVDEALDTDPLTNEDRQTAV